MLQQNIKDSEFECEIDKRELEDWETKLQDRKLQLKDLYKKQSGETPYKAWLYHKKANQLHQDIRKFRRKIKFWKGELEQDQIYLKEDRESLEEFLKEAENLPLG